LRSTVLAEVSPLRPGQSTADRSPTSAPTARKAAVLAPRSTADGAVEAGRVAEFGDRHDQRGPSALSKAAKA